VGVPEGKIQLGVWGNNVKIQTGREFSTVVKDLMLKIVFSLAVSSFEKRV
jgi:hypothetical protein